jgi:hypothetical protein
MPGRYSGGDTLWQSRIRTLIRRARSAQVGRCLFLKIKVWWNGSYSISGEFARSDVVYANCASSCLFPSPKRTTRIDSDLNSTVTPKIQDYPERTTGWYEWVQFLQSGINLKGFGALQCGERLHGPLRLWRICGCKPQHLASGRARSRNTGGIRK